jgi:5-methylcytosine-specific restriction endonuclease McrA
LYLPRDFFSSLNNSKCPDYCKSCIRIRNKIFRKNRKIRLGLPDTYEGRDNGRFTSAGVKRQWEDSDYREKMRLATSGAKNKNFKDAKKQSQCIICGTSFFYYPSTKNSTGEYCSRNCMHKSPKRRAAVARALTGKKLSPSHIKSLHDSHVGKFLGPNSPTWKGGVAKMNCHIRGSFEYDRWRTRIFERDLYTCRDCGVVGKNIIVHHIMRYATIIAKYKITNYAEAVKCNQLWDIDNGLTLCKPCHKKLHTKETEEKRMLKCINARKYKGIRKPNCNKGNPCKWCLGIWHEKHSEMLSILSIYESNIAEKLNAVST